MFGVAARGCCFCCCFLGAASTATHPPPPLIKRGAVSVTEVGVGTPTALGVGGATEVEVGTPGGVTKIEVEGAPMAEAEVEVGGDGGMGSLIKRPEVEVKGDDTSSLIERVPLSSTSTCVPLSLTSDAGG